MSEATQDLIGKILDATAERDAIHIAVAPVEAAQQLAIGQKVGLKDGRAVATAPHIGIVDPYLTRMVKPGERFFLFLFPNSATGLRHVYTHPVLDSKEVAEKAASEKWLREFAEAHYHDYDERPEYDSYAALLRDAKAGDFCFNSQPDWLYYEGAPEKLEMWSHLEKVMGRTLSYNHKAGATFRCSC